MYTIENTMKAISTLKKELGKKMPKQIIIFRTKKSAIADDYNIKHLSELINGEETDDTVKGIVYLTLKDKILKSNTKFQKFLNEKVYTAMQKKIASKKKAVKNLMTVKFEVITLPVPKGSPEGTQGETVLVLQMIER